MASADVIYPQPKDVLSGKTKESFNHVGNRRFRIMIALYLKQYLDLKTRIERGELIVSIVEAVESGGGRFLNRRNNRWICLSPKQAREKVGHALRDAAMQHRRAKNSDDTATDSVSDTDKDDDEVEAQEPQEPQANRPNKRIKQGSATIETKTTTMALPDAVESSFHRRRSSAALMRRLSQMSWERRPSANELFQELGHLLDDSDFEEDPFLDMIADLEWVEC